MMIGRFVKTLRREQRLLPAQVLANGGGAGERLGQDQTVMEAPEKVRRDEPTSSA
jgi:hypothetical protein